jgi:ADP-ribosylglycohydrolase
MNFSKKYQERIYAGVLGKIIGVYLGRPVEGWSYGQIVQRFGEVNYYINEDLNLPLIVADDDISGPFAFFRSIEDNDDSSRKICSRDVGNTWLNYIIENKTILWWGGFGNSVEHTAYLRLKQGVSAPASGSIALNGPVLAQQIGAQIFMDAYAMMCPGDPEEAVYYVREAASVSHDGIAVDAACFLGAMEALAFDESNIAVILDTCSRFIKTPEIRSLVQSVRNICIVRENWREVRDWIDEHYGYHKYPGSCPIITNHAAVLASILLGRDSFERSITIASSSAWDTDCNAGNVGCFNGIRLGIEGIERGRDYRSAVADRLYVVTSDGGETISDAVRESRKIIRAAAKRCGQEYDEPEERYAFEFPGSLQGFTVCPLVAMKGQGVIKIGNSNTTSHSEQDSTEHDCPNGLIINLEDALEDSIGFVSAATFLEYSESYNNYETLASPSLYGGQLVTFVITSGEGKMRVTPYICITDEKDRISVLYSDETEAGAGEQKSEWPLPDTRGMPICRFGFRLRGGNGYVIIKKIGWKGTPSRFEQTGILMKDMWDLSPYWSRAFVSSAYLFAPNLNHTYSISHFGGPGLATIGTRDFTDYTVRSTLKLSLHKNGGIVVRSCGHRRYYAAILHEGNCFSIIKRKDEKTEVLQSTGFPYEESKPYTISFSVRGKILSAAINGKILLDYSDDNPYKGGAAGFIVEDGTMYIDGFLLQQPES